MKNEYPYFLEFILAEVVILLLFWVNNEYLATVVSLLIPAIVLGVLVVSFIAEKIEASKVPKSYFVYLMVVGLIPLLIFCVYFVLNDFEVSWIKE